MLLFAASGTGCAAWATQWKRWWRMFQWRRVIQWGVVWRRWSVGGPCDAMRRDDDEIKGSEL